jgi:TRAP-type C4-dicarboxylate transport system permease small subunit
VATRVQIEHCFKIIICKNRKTSVERETNVRKSTSIQMSGVAGFMAIMTVAGDYVAWADDGTQSVTMLLISLPCFLILVVGAGVIGSVAFLFIIVAEVMRRRRRKYSPIQH